MWRLRALWLKARTVYVNAKIVVRREWRLFRGRCVVCNGPHVAVGGWPKTSHLCGWCVKRARHGMNYGMGQERMKEVLGIH